jgi:hypothetical protein
MENDKPQLALKNAVKIATSYYNQLKNEGFTDNQAFELVKNAAPKQLEIKLKKNR